MNNNLSLLIWRAEKHGRSARRAAADLLDLAIGFMRRDPGTRSDPFRGVLPIRVRRLGRYGRGQRRRLG